MKPLILAASVSVVLAGMAGEATAACSAATRVNTKARLSAVLVGNPSTGGNTVCVPPATVPDMKWQELHVGGTGAVTGDLVDYKRGPNHPIDPSEKVGTWTLTGADGRGVSVKHDYGPGHVYVYSVHANGGDSYSFCVAVPDGPEIVARIKPGGGPC